MIQLSIWWPVCRPGGSDQHHRLTVCIKFERKKTFEPEKKDEFDPLMTSCAALVKRSQFLNLNDDQQSLIAAELDHPTWMVIPSWYLPLAKLDDQR